MRFTSAVTSAAVLATAHASVISLGGDNGGFNGNVENGVATVNGYTCTGAIYMGCDMEVTNAFCCEGVEAQNNICNGGQPTTCTAGTQVPLTQAAAVSATTTAADTSATSSSDDGEIITGGITGNNGGQTIMVTANGQTTYTVSNGQTLGASAASKTSASTSQSTGAAATAGMLPGHIGAAGIAAVVVKVLFL